MKAQIQLVVAGRYNDSCQGVIGSKHGAAFSIHCRFQSWKVGQPQAEYAWRIRQVGKTIGLFRNGLDRHRGVGILPESVRRTGQWSDKNRLSRRNSRPLLFVIAMMQCGLTGLLLLSAYPLFSQAPPDQVTDPAAQASSAAANDRIFGVIPNYQTVSDPQKKIVPLTVKQKFGLFAKETFDPFIAVSSAAGAALSQADNDHPKYGQGSGPYAERFGAAVADVTTQNFFSDAVLASLLHEDPRYFRRGQEYRFWPRFGYALSRVVVTRTDAGRPTFNYSGIFGMAMGIALSNAYYPDSSVSGSVVATRLGTSLVASALSNILPEFWPDIRRKVFRRKP